MKRNENCKAISYNKILEQEFSYVYQRCKEKVERKAFYLTGSNQSMKDIAQEVFLKLWLKWPLLNAMPEDCLEDYIYVMTRNYLINEQKAVKRGREYSRYYTHCVSECCWHDDTILKDGFLIYKKAVKQLPVKEKAVYSFFENNYSREEIAQMVERSPNTVNNQLRTASQAVKEYLNKNFDLNIGKDGRRKIWKSSLN